MVKAYIELTIRLYNQNVHILMARGMLTVLADMVVTVQPSQPREVQPPSIGPALTGDDKTLQANSTTTKCQYDFTTTKSATSTIAN